MHLFALAVRQFLLLVHLMTFAFAVVIVLQANAALLTARHVDATRLLRTHRILMRLLGLLWGTGLGLALFETGLDLGTLPAHAALAAKLGVTGVLTVVALLMHGFAIPRLTRLQRHPRRVATACSLLGATGTVSWLFAALLGTARWLSPVAGLPGFTALYVVALVAGWLVGLEVVRPRIERLLKRHEPHAKIERALYAVFGRAATVLLDKATRRAHVGKPWAYAHALAARIPDSMAADRRVFLERVQPLLQPHD